MLSVRDDGRGFEPEMAQTQRLVSTARGLCPIIFTTIAYRPDLRDAGFWAIKVPWLRHCTEDSDAVTIDPRLDVQADDVVLVDWNVDGNLDVLTSNGEDNSVWLFPGKGCSFRVLSFF